MTQSKTDEEREVTSGRTLGRKLLRHKNAVLALVLAILIAVMAVVTKGHTASRTNAVNILLESSIRGIASVGQAFVSNRWHRRFGWWHGAGVFGLRRLPDY